MLSTRKHALLTGLIVAALLGQSRSGMAATDARLVDMARARGRAAVVVLIRQRADVNATEPDGSTALHWAAHWDDSDVADALIRAGARVNATNQFGVTPLWLASENGSARMIEKLLAAGADPNIAL